MEQLPTLPGVDIPGFQGSGRNPVQRTGVSLFSLVSIIFYAYIDILLLRKNMMFYIIMSFKKL